MRLDYPDIEMKGFHLFKNKMITEFLTQNIYLPRHHLQKHSNRFQVAGFRLMMYFSLLHAFHFMLFASCFMRHANYLLQHDPIVIQSVFTSDKSRFWFPFFDIISGILLKRLFRYIRQISHKHNSAVLLYKGGGTL